MAKPITISVSDELHKKLKKNIEIKVSPICQRALEEVLDNKSRIGMDKLVVEGANRLKSECLALKDDVSKCFDEGREWAAKRATLEELVWVFEDGELYLKNGLSIQENEILKKIEGSDHQGELWLKYSGTFGNETFGLVDEEKDYSSDNELFWSFVDGARSMWHEMKLILGE
jgi:hypothetical protein